MSCRPVLQTLNIQFRKILYISLDENLISFLYAVPVVQELGKLVVISRHGSKIVSCDNVKLSQVTLHYHVHLHWSAKRHAPRQDIVIETCLSSRISHAHVIRRHVLRTEPLVYLLSVNKEIVGDVSTFKKLRSCGNLLEEIRHHTKMATEILFHNL